VKFCPLLRRECIKEGCAWYDGAYDKCAILTVARALDYILMRERR